MLINWFHKKAYIEPDLKLYMNPISKCKGVRHDDPQGVIFGGKKYFLCVNYAEICVNGNAELGKINSFWHWEWYPLSVPVI